MLFPYIRAVQSIWLLQRPLLVGIDVHPTAATQLASIGPRVARHPGLVTGGTKVFTEASLLSLVRGDSLLTGARLHEVVGANDDGSRNLKVHL